MRAAVHVKSSHAAPGPMPCVTVEDGAAALACPPDYIAVPLLVCAGAVMGNRWQIVLKPGFRRLPTLFAAIVGLTGAAKSPALGFVRHPVDVLQSEAKARFDAATIAYQTALARWQQQRKEQVEVEARPDAPQLEHYFTTNATTEAIAQMPGASAGLALIADELVG